MQALALFEEQEPIWRDLGDRGGLASCLSARAVALMVAGRHADALTPLQEAATIWRELDEPRRLKAVHGDQGTALQKLGRYDEALAVFTEEESFCLSAGRVKLRTREHYRSASVSSPDEIPDFPAYLASRLLR